MGKRKRKMIVAEKAEKKRRQQKHMTIFVNGKQRRVERPPAIDGLPVDEFIRNNADPIWLLQEESQTESATGARLSVVAGTGGLPNRLI